VLSPVLSLCYIHSFFILSVSGLNVKTDVTGGEFMLYDSNTSMILTIAVCVPILVVCVSSRLDPEPLYCGPVSVFPPSHGD